MNVTSLSIYLGHCLISILQFLAHKPCICFVKFIPNFFRLSVAIVMVLKDLNIHLFFLYIEPIDFCILIFYSSTLLKALISSNSYLKQLYRDINHPLKVHIYTLKYTIQWFLIYSQNCATITTIILEHFLSFLKYILLIMLLQLSHFFLPFIPLCHAPHTHTHSFPSLSSCP